MGLRLPPRLPTTLKTEPGMILMVRPGERVLPRRGETVHAPQFPVIATDQPEPHRLNWFEIVFGTAAIPVLLAIGWWRNRS